MGIVDTALGGGKIPSIWEKEALGFIFFISISLILAYYSETQFDPELDISPLWVYGSVAAFAVSGVCLHFIAGPKGRNGTSKTLFGKAMILAFVASSFSVLALEMIFATYFLRHPEPSLAYILSITAFMAPFVKSYLSMRK